MAQAVVSETMLKTKIRRAIERFQMDAYCFAPLFNFTTNLSEINLVDGCSISVSTEEENQLIKGKDDIFTPRLLPPWKFIIRTASCKALKRNDTSGELALMGKIYDVYKAMIVFKGGVLGLGTQYVVQTAPYKCTHLGKPENLEYVPKSETYSLSRREALSFISFYDKFRSVDFRKHRELHLAVLRLCSSLWPAEPIDLMVGFEALYLGDEQELAYKMAMRASYLLGKTAEERKYLYKLLKKAYAIRSKLVHGVGHDIPEEVEITEGKRVSLYEFMNEVQNILRESIKKFMELEGRYSHKQLVNTVLDDNVLIGGTLLR